MGHKDFYRIKRQSVWIQTERHWLTESWSQILKIQANPVTHKHRINKNEVWYLGLFSLLTIFNSSFLIFSDKKWYAFMKWIINGTIGETHLGFRLLLNQCYFLIEHVLKEDVLISLHNWLFYKNEKHRYFSHWLWMINGVFFLLNLF